MLKAPQQPAEPQPTAETQQESADLQVATPEPELVSTVSLADDDEKPPSFLNESVSGESMPPLTKEPFRNLTPAELEQANKYIEQCAVHEEELKAEQEEAKEAVSFPFSF